MARWCRRGCGRPAARRSCRRTCRPSRRRRWRRRRTPGSRDRRPRAGRRARPRDWSLSSGHSPPRRAESQCSSWVTMPLIRPRRVGSSSTPSTDCVIGASRTSSGSPDAASMMAVSESTWWSTSCWRTSMLLSLRWAGSRRPPGGWKCTPLGAGQLERPEGDGGLRTHRGRRGAVRAGEGAGERLVRAVAGLDGDVEDGAVAVAQQAVRRPLHQQPTPQRARRLATGGGHERGRSGSARGRRGRRGPRR